MATGLKVFVKTYKTKYLPEAQREWHITSRHLQPPHPNVTGRSDSGSSDTTTVRTYSTTLWTSILEMACVHCQAQLVIGLAVTHHSMCYAP